MNSTLQERQKLLEMGAFAYAVGIASLAVIHLPLIRYGALPLLAISLLGIGYAMLFVARQSSSQATLFQGIALVALVALSGILYTFGAEFAQYKTLKLHHALTEADKASHIKTVWMLVTLHTAGALLFVAALWARTRSFTRTLIPLFAIAWLSLPVVYLLIQLFERLLPLMEKSSTLFLFLAWLALTAGVGYGSYLMTGGKKLYTGLLALLTFVLPPVGAVAFVLFLFVRGLMLLKES
ncbi:hypothetical protein LOH54_11740 [Sulfurimonas sp. HSL-3221]|uniref:hypothetical protein n=1 Tax=Sulfurimonadaceae TaxID=2771471 RepID=UPI001E3E3381|nr:hypothetical protein [Sulfurimonas sp. HSL-3221]UFS62310.1 hypothetical protein LOH54_11740 [Sulfurimonas sp. HSL-3221]